MMVVVLEKIKVQKIFLGIITFIKNYVLFGYKYIKRRLRNICVVSFDVPEEVLLDLHEDKADFTEYIKCMVALDLYKNKKVSLGYCASTSGMSKEEFVKYLGENKVSIFDFESDDEFLEELANA